jgi:hypothetical protein
MARFPVSENTARQYWAIGRWFDEWRRERGLRLPLSPEQVALYLRFAERHRGLSVVPQHLSAIARIHRQLGHTFDTKAPAIQAVVSKARRSSSHP